MTDHYSVLGLEKNATEADIKKAYRKKAQELHPDKNQGNKTAEAKFKEVQNAYEVLSDKQNRSRYDQFGSAEGNFTQGGGAGFDPSQFAGFADIFESFFGDYGFGGGRSNKQGPMRGNDIETEIQIKFEEAVFGTVKELEMTKPEQCDHCTGSGTEPGSLLRKCPTCQGQGKIRSTRQTILGAMSSVQVCPQCHGRGETPDKICSKCNGQTRIKKTQTVEIKIPKGIEDGTTIRIKGKGAAGIFGGEYGDLFLHMKVAGHPKFSREGRSIFSEEHIPLVQAVLGSDIKVDTIHGKETLKVPAGTQDGTVFTIKGKGSPSLKTEALGDHKVTIHIKVPEKLNKKERELFQALAQEQGVEVNKSGFGLF